MTPEQQLSFWLEVSRWSVSPTPSDAKQRAADVDAYVDSLLAQARADALEECAIGLEVRMANVIRANSRGSRVGQAASFAADMLQAEAAAIRARKEQA